MAKKKKTPGEQDNDVATQDDGFGDLENLFFAQDAGTFVRDEAPEGAPAVPTPPAPPPKPTRAATEPTPRIDLSTSASQSMARKAEPPPRPPAPSGPPTPGPVPTPPRPVTVPPPRTPEPEPDRPLATAQPTIVPPTLAEAAAVSSWSGEPAAHDEEPPVRDEEIPPPPPSFADIPEAGPSSVEEDPAVRDFFSTGRIPTLEPREAAIAPSEDPRPRGAAPQKRAGATDLAAAPVDALPSPAVVDPAGSWVHALGHLAALAEAEETPEARARLWFEIGRIRSQRLGDWDGAEDLAKRSLASARDYTPALREMVRISASRERWGDAVGHLVRQAEASTTPSARAAARLAAAQIRLAQLGDVPGAEADLRAALKEVPESYIARRFLREIHYRQEQWEDLVTVLGEARAGVGAADGLRLSYELGRLFDEILRRPDEACARFGDCLQADPLFVPALLAVLRLAPAQARVGDLPGIYAAFARAAGGADAGWAWLRAARVADREIGDIDAAVEYYRQAAAGPEREVALDEWVALLSRAGREDDASQVLSEWLADEADPHRRAAIHMRLGESELFAGRSGAAKDAFTAALDLRPDLAPAREGLRISLAMAGDWTALVDFYDQGAAATGDVRMRVAYHVKAAELREERLSDLGGAIESWRHALSASPRYLPAREGLVRCLVAAGRFAEAAEVAEETADLLDGPESRAAWLLYAGQTWAWRAGEAARAADCLSRAAEAPPGPSLALMVATEVLGAAGRWEDACRLLRGAGGRAADSRDRASLLYRAGRIALARLGDRDLAAECFRDGLEQAPDLAVAAMDLREVHVAARSFDALASLDEREALGAEDAATRVSLLLSAARHAERAHRLDRATEHLRAVHEADPGNQDAFRSLWRLLAHSGRPKVLVDVLRGALAAADPATAATLRLQLLEPLRGMGQADAAAEIVGELLAVPTARPLPFLGLGAFAEGMGRWEAAVAAYGAAARDGATPAARASATYQRGLLHEEFQEDADAAARDYEEALAQSPGHAMALDGLERIYTSRRDRAGLARIYGLQAESDAPAPVRSFYALLAGDFHVELGLPDDAARCYRVAFEDPVGRERAFEALRRILVGAKDGRGLVDLTEEFAAGLGAPEDAARRMEAADLLVQAGDEALATEVYERVRAQDPGDLAAAWHLMELYPRLQRWNSLLGLVEETSRRVRVEAVRQDLAATRDRVVTQHDVDLPEYLPFFEELHARDGRNALALKGLGAIALRERRYDDAEIYLTELDEVAPTPPMKATAAVLLGRLESERGGDHARAAELFEKALSLDPDCGSALAALRDLYARTENWKGLVGVLSREAASAPEDRRVSLYAEIATLWEDQLANPRVAAASWQKVVQQQPEHEVAYEHLLGIYRSEGDWGAWLDVAAARVDRMPAAERPGFLFELGRVAETELRDLDQAVAFYERAVADPQPSPDALGALRRMARLRGDWDRVIDLAAREAAVATGVEERVALHVESARIRLDHLLDREGAAKEFRAARALDPHQPDALAFFVDYDFDTENWAGARQVFEAYERTTAQRDLDDDDEREEVTAYYYKFGRVLAALGDEAEAIRRFEQALEVTPAHLPSLEEVAPRHFARKDWGAASESYKTILRLRGGTSDNDQALALNLQLGLAELEMGKVDSAQKRFKKVLEINGNHIGGLKGIARIYYLREDWNSLLSTYNAIIKYARDPDEVITAYMTKGDVLDEKLGFADKAVLHYEKVLNYDKQNPRAMRRLAEIAWKRGETLAASSWSDKATAASRSPGDRVQSLLLSAVVRGGGSVGRELVEQAERVAGDAGIPTGPAREMRGAGTEPDAMFEAYRRSFPLSQS
ncbi:tetratricopeptide repeat protein [Myxococcota bacterium]|nr:tetratricopeptide repeat protein [Myxococcota bacterium]